MPRIIAHRGASAAAPENTLAAFRTALEQQADGIELDIHLSKDGVPVVCHDTLLLRTTGQPGRISDYTVRELKDFDAGSWFGPQFAGERLPLLSEVLELCSTQEPDFIINIELKSGSKLYPGIEEKAVAAVDGSHYRGRIIYSSFDHYALRRLKEINRHLKTGVLYGAALVDPWRYRDILAFDALHPAWHTLTPEIIREAHAHGLEINTFTVDDLFYAQQLISAGVDAIITNVPDRLIDLRSSMRS